MSESNQDNKKSSSRSIYFKWGLTIFITALAVILIYALFFKGSEIRTTLSNVASSIAPVLWGIFIAYLLWHVVEFVQRYLNRWIKIQDVKKKRRLVRVIAIVLSLLLFIILMVLLIRLILPALWEAVSTFVKNLPGYEEKARVSLANIAKRFPWLGNMVGSTADNLFDDLSKLVSSKIGDNLQDIISAVSSGVISFGKGVANFLIGIIVAVYIMASKEVFSIQGKKILFATFSEERALRIMRRNRKNLEIFDNFVTRKILDSLIVGVLCFIGLTILRIPYALLISVLVGVTNVIPIVGPLIGAIPSAFLLLLVDPWKAVIFVIFIIALQQLDGNVIGPKILGEGLGLSAFWIIVALLVGGATFGVIGMFFAVPIFAIIFDMLRDRVNRKLEAKNIPANGPFPDEGLLLETEKKSEKRSGKRRWWKKGAEKNGADAGEEAGEGADGEEAVSGAGEGASSAAGREASDTIEEAKDAAEEAKDADAKEES